MGSWEYFLSPAYAPEFAYTFSGSGTGGIEIVESLCWLERRASRKWDVVTYPVQVVDKLNRLLLIEVSHPLSILLSVEDLVDLVVEVG